MHNREALETEAKVCPKQRFAGNLREQFKRETSSYFLGKWSSGH